METLTIDWVETKTGARGPYQVASIVRPDGEMVHNVYIFSNFPGYPFSPGVKISGSIDMSGKYKNLKFGKTVQRTIPMQTQSPISIAMDRKNTMVQRAQDNKELGIRVAGAMRDATLIVTQMYPELAKITDQEVKEKAIQEKWHHWRGFFFDQWENRDVQTLAGDTA